MFYSIEEIKPLRTAPSTKFLIILMTSVLTLSPIGTNQPRAMAEQSQHGGTLVWGTVNPPTLINPVLTSHSVSSSLLDLVFDPLVHVDQKGNIVPSLAQSWEISPNGLEYTFHLRTKVYFHDGMELTAEDVKFTYEEIVNPSNQSPVLGNLDLISRWEIINKYTLRAILKEPVPNFLSNLKREILPKHLYVNTDLAKNPHNYSPIGTGAFRLKQWRKENNEITLEANAQYFEGRPLLDKIIIRVYPNSSALWAALMRGEVDLVKFLNAQDYKVLSKDPTFKTYQVPVGLYFAITFNTHDPILFDRTVRQAISYAIDRKSLMQAAGIDGVETNGPFFPGSPWFNNDVESSSYNPIRAKMLLAGRGWKLGEEGILKKGGKLLTLTMLLIDRNREDYRHMALTLRQQLSEIGIGLKIEFYDHDGQLTPEYLEKSRPQMWLRMFLGGIGNPADMARNWYSQATDFGKLWTYQDKYIDELFEQGRKLKDGPERVKVYKKLHALINKDQSNCFLFFTVTYHAVAKKVQGSDAFFTDYMPGYLLKYWYIQNP